MTVADVVELLVRPEGPLSTQKERKIYEMMIPTLTTDMA